MSAALPQLDIVEDIIGKVTTFDPATGLPNGHAVIQRAVPENATYYNAAGQPRLIRAYVIGANPRTPRQQSFRARHAAAVAAWQADPATCRALVHAEALHRRISDFMAWCSLYHRTHPIDTPAYWDSTWSIWDEYSDTWDATESPWDAGASPWDTTDASTWDAGASSWDQRDPSAWDAALTVFDRTDPTTWDDGNSTWTN